MAESANSVVNISNITLDENENSSCEEKCIQRNDIINETDLVLESAPDLLNDSKVSSCSDLLNCSLSNNNCHIEVPSVLRKSCLQDEDCDFLVSNNVLESQNTNKLNNSSNDLNIANNGFGEIFSQLSNEKNVQFTDEVFHDAVQFFKDPASLKFLENAGASTVSSESVLTRSSLYMNFDPLHEKFSSQLQSKSNGLQSIIETASMSEENGNKNIVISQQSDCCLVDISSRESLSSVLIPLLPSTSGNEKSDSSENVMPSEPKKCSVDELPQDIQTKELDSQKEMCLENSHEHGLSSDSDSMFNYEKDDIPAEVVDNRILDIKSRESLNNILISFSPVNGKNVTSRCPEEVPSQPEKVYTEEEFQHSLKALELHFQELLLKKEQGFEFEITRKVQEHLEKEEKLELEMKIKQQEIKENYTHLKNLCYAYNEIVQEFPDITAKYSDKQKELVNYIQTIEEENKKLKEELKVATEDFQSVDTAFSDLHKRYEQTKSMLKVYKDNEDSLKKQFEDMQSDLQQEQTKMYAMLQSKTQEAMEKANLEMANAKKSSDAQVSVLKAQLQKSELKISGLESELKQAKIENSKLGSICDDLMAKVGGT